MAKVLTLLRADKPGEALTAARAWQAEAPADVMALVALGEALESSGDLALAARVYGSIIDLFPSRADMRRMAGERLEPLGAIAVELVVDTYRVALSQRPDHPSGHRLLAYALLKRRDYAGAWEVLDAAVARGFREDRFPGVQAILQDDMGLVAAAWLRTDETVSERVKTDLAARGATLADKPSLRFVLNWETDANDVDFHIHDGRGGHAFYQAPRLGSGGKLYADIIDGYGPECFAIEGKPRGFPYTLQAHYFSRGPMGYGMGKLQVVQHDGEGRLAFEVHPFSIMKDRAFVRLAVVAEPML
jgi:hypothetical protein